jgi:hypothetical protein
VHRFELTSRCNFHTVGTAPHRIPEQLPRLTTFESVRSVHHSERCAAELGATGALKAGLANFQLDWPCVVHADNDGLEMCGGAELGPGGGEGHHG